jgi:hypothetical protein
VGRMNRQSPALDQNLRNGPGRRRRAAVVAVAIAVATLGASTALAGGDDRGGGHGGWREDDRGGGHDPGPGHDRDRGPKNAFVRDFARADSSSGAMFRWWWPGAAVEERELVREIDAIADAGYKGVEIADVMDGVEYAVDPDKYGYGTERWNRAVEIALEAADRRDLQVDLTLGARWPAAVPGLDVDGVASSKELTYGYQLVRDGAEYDGGLPAPAPRTYEDRTSDDGVISTDVKTAQPEYVTVTAVRCLEDCATEPLAVDLHSQIDLSDQVAADGTLTWTPPADGTWAVVAYWYRGTGQRNDAPFGDLPHLLTDPESRVIDHYSRVGTRAFIDYFDGLLDRDSRRLLRQTGGALFEDSLELTHSQAWTPDFLDRFEDLRGYSLVPYLATIARQPPRGPFGQPALAFAFAGEDAAAAERVRRDVEQTLNDLYIEEHVEPIRRWAHSLGLDYRAQPYGEPLDMAEVAAKVDIAESESLGCGTCDDWRLLATGTAMAGHRIVSDEMIPGGFGGTYRVSRQGVVEQANAEYSLGANQMIFHGFPYATWPDSADGTITDSSALWPGYHGFPARIPEPFGPRQPEWTMDEDFAGYLARTQRVLQEGRLETDVAVYNQSLDHISSEYSDPSLLDAGYSYGYVTPGSLALPAARVSRGRLAPQGPAFKALILDEQESMPLSSARKLLEFARDGLAIVVVGEPPARTPGYAATAAAAAAEDAELQDVIAELLGERRVRRVADTAAVPETLDALGVQPAATSSDGAVRTTHRVDGDTHYYYVYNSSDEAVNATLSLSGARGGVPYALDPWTGEITRVAEYTTDRGGDVRTSVSLRPSEAKLFAIDRDHRSGDDDLHVTSTTADAALVVDGDLVVRVSSEGRYTTRLSNGRVVRERVGGLPEPMDVPTWDLAVDEYLPGSAGDPSSHTRHVHHRFDGIALSPWADIPEITDAVGVGRYTATVRLPHGWSRDDGAYLDLGTVNGSYRVRVNDRDVGVANQLGEVVDVGPYLRRGSNRIEVAVATTMVNRLRVFRPQEYGNQPKQDYGLLGPVTLRPYREVELERRGRGCDRRGHDRGRGRHGDERRHCHADGHGPGRHDDGR